MSEAPGSVARVGSDVPADEVLGLAIALVRQAAALGTALAERTGLHATDVRALHALDLAAGEDGITMGALAQEIGLTPQATTALVTRLEARDLARREPYPGDRRRTRVVLGPAARTFGQQHLAPLAARLGAAAAALDPDERAAAARFLRACTSPD